MILLLDGGALGREAMLQAVDGLTQWSHIWVLTHFHQKKNFKSKIRPPRLGGKLKMGVLATRSPERPNGIGLTLVEVLSIKNTPNGVRIEVRGGDWLDQTPVLDIKPYLPYADKPVGVKIRSPFKTSDFSKLKVKLDPAIKALGLSKLLLNQIRGVVSLDPRPENQKGKKTVFGFTFDQYNVRFKVQGASAIIIEITWP